MGPLSRSIAAALAVSVAACGASPPPEDGGTMSEDAGLPQVNLPHPTLLGRLHLPEALEEQRPDLLPRARSPEPLPAVVPAPRSGLEIPGPGLPQPPVDVVAWPLDRCGLVRWRQLPSGPLLSFTVRASTGSIAVVLPTLREVRLCGLTNGVPCSFTVTANGAAGDSPASAPSNEIIPNATP